MDEDFTERQRWYDEFVEDVQSSGFGRLEPNEMVTRAITNADQYLQTGDQKYKIAANLYMGVAD